jgi:copper chaperone
VNFFKEPDMPTFQVPGIRCGHCVRAIKEAVRGLDPSAELDVDLARRQVRVRSGRLDALSVRDALAQAGYPAVPEDAPVEGASTGCCGCATARCACVA